MALTACNGVNLNRAYGEVLEAMVRYGFRRITIGLDGAGQETYSTYRVGERFQEVIGHIRCP